MNNRPSVIEVIEGQNKRLSVKILEQTKNLLAY